MIRRREIGIVSIYTRSGGGSYGAHPSYFDKLKDAWMRGEAFCEVRGMHGDTLIVKLASVEAIALTTGAQIASTQQEEAADNADDMIAGND